LPGKGESKPARVVGSDGGDKIPSTPAGLRSIRRVPQGPRGFPAAIRFGTVRGGFGTGPGAARIARRSAATHPASLSFARAPRNGQRLPNGHSLRLGGAEANI
jgi:hypothetical protein